jgi:adenylate kinase family enzyme
VRRISVVGNSGSGKSWLAGTLAARIGVPHIELDAVFHLPNWKELPADEFRRQIDDLTAADGWVVDGNYLSVRDVVWDRADTVVWVDPPRALVMFRVISRSLARVLGKRELWNSNRERWSNLISTDPAKSIVAWSWTQHQPYRDRYTSAMADPAWAHLAFIRLRTASDTKTLVSSLGPRPGVETRLADRRRTDRHRADDGSI